MSNSVPSGSTIFTSKPHGKPGDPILFSPGGSGLENMLPPSLEPIAWINNKRKLCQKLAMQRRRQRRGRRPQEANPLESWSTLVRFGDHSNRATGRRWSAQSRTTCTGVVQPVPELADAEAMRHHYRSSTQQGRNQRYALGVDVIKRKHQQGAVRGSQLMRSHRISAPAKIVRCVCTAALGCPVLPDVYISSATSSAEGTAGRERPRRVRCRRFSSEAIDFSRNHAYRPAHLRHHLGR